MSYFCFGVSIFKEVPILRWSNGIHELSLFVFYFLFFLIFFSVFSKELFLILNSFSVIIIDNSLNLRWFLALEGLEKNGVLNILNNHIIHIFKLLCSFEPLFSISFVIVAIPYPKSSISFSI